MINTKISFSKNLLKMYYIYIQNEISHHPKPLSPKTNPHLTNI